MHECMCVCMCMNVYVCVCECVGGVCVCGVGGCACVLLRGEKSLMMMCALSPSNIFSIGNAFGEFISFTVSV